MTMVSPHILFVDDDQEIRTLTARFLNSHGMDVTLAANGSEAREFLDAKPTDLMVMDIMMPGEDGLEVTRALRGQGVSVPIILLTALGEDADRIVGLEMGADDYLTKPFNPRELLARIRAVLRRSALTAEAQASSQVRGLERKFAGWTLSLASRDLVSPDGDMVILSAGDYDLLVVLLDHPKRTLSRDQLLDMVRGRTAAVFDRSIDILVSRLRRKLKDDAKNPQLIKTVRSGGYLFTADVEVL